MTVFMYALIFGVLAALSASVIWGLWWALRGGQFSDFQRGAMSIFDEDEPQGHVTDRGLQETKDKRHDTPDDKPDHP